MQSSQDKLNELEHGETVQLRFNADGLVTAVAQEISSGKILMLAHMNEDAFDKTLETGAAHFWSRSRQKLWMKGETSGNRLLVRDILVDCDQDAVILQVQLEGDGACHTGAHSCFYRKVEKSGNQISLTKVD